MSLPTCCFQTVYLYYSDSGSDKDQRKIRFLSNINAA